MNFETGFNLSCPSSGQDRGWFVLVFFFYGTGCVGVCCSPAGEAEPRGSGLPCAELGEQGQGSNDTHCHLISLLGRYGKGSLAVAAKKKGVSF